VIVRKKVKVEAIRIAVEREFSTRLDDHRNIPAQVRARHCAWYLARCYTALSTNEIGRHLGKHFHHTTVLHGIEKMQKVLTIDSATCLVIMKLAEQLTGEIGLPTIQTDRMPEPAPIPYPDFSGEWAI
jgi:chromosomal replication initiation ATPase DnaA